MSERDQVVRQWEEAEARLYPVVTVRPDLYEAGIGLVRSLAEHLARVPDMDALVASYRSVDAAADLAQAGIAQESIPPGIDALVVRGAAYQMRAREIAGEQAQAATDRAIRRARGGGERSVVLWSVGEQPDLPPYRRVEMSLDTGRALCAWSEWTPELSVLYAVEVVQLDPQTGQAADEEPIIPRREIADPARWRDMVDGLRQTVLSP